MRSQAASICAGRPLQQAGQAVDVVLGQPVEVVGDDLARELALLGVLDRRRAAAAGTRRRCARRRRRGSSDCTRFSAICISSSSTARRHAARRGDLVERDAQVAVVVERLDDGAGERVVALVERQHVDLAVQVLAQADVGGDQVERADVGFRALRADAGGRLLPGLALVRRVGDRRRRLEVDAARLAVGADLADVDAAGVLGRVLDLEEGVASHRVLHLLGEVEGRELKQAYGVLQAGRDGVLLSLARLQGGHRHRICALSKGG